MLITQIQGKKPSELTKSQIQHLTFDKIRKKWIIEDSEDQSYEYDEILERWVPTGEGEKHKRDSDDPEEAKLALKRMKKEEIEKKKLEKQNRKRPNTSIYVTGMPKDISVEELKDTFGRCGVIAEDLKTGKPRIKMYEDENGQFKGDCLIRYFRAESCDLAMEILDGTKIRPGDGEEMKISMAVFDEERTVKKEPLKFKDKLNVKKRIKEMNDRLADWSDSDSEEDRRRKRRKEYVIVLKHCFTLDELKEDALAISDIKEDIKEGCGEIGKVTDVTVYDLEPEGVVGVKFTNEEEAELCLKRMNGRYFGGEKLEAELWDGTIYRASKGASKGSKVDS